VNKPFISACDAIKQSRLHCECYGLAILFVFLDISTSQADRFQDLNLSDDDIDSPQLHTIILFPLLSITQRHNRPSLHRRLPRHVRCPQQRRKPRPSTLVCRRHIEA